MFSALLRWSPLSAGTVLYLYLQTKRLQKDRENPDLPFWTDRRLQIYTAFSNRAFSRAFGWMTSREFPRFLQMPVLRLFANTYGCNMREAENSQLEDYPSLLALFRRRLKEGARTIAQSGLVSPADGYLHSFGEVENGRLPQVKGCSYDTAEFLGDLPVLKGDRYKLMYCLIYLAPGDYHHFHSPSSWTISGLKHFAGELYSVAPIMLKRIPKLFCKNERVVLSGQWKHGYFSFTAVAAKNVGDIRLTSVQIETNSKQSPPATVSHQNIDWTVQKGQELGEFRFGSSIVIIFEAPMNFAFSKTESGSIRLGEALCETQ